MKTICLVGGKLQGFELAYLAKKAEMKTVLVDRNPKALIRNYTDEFHCFDIIENPGRLIELSKKADALIPLNENPECITFLESVKDKLFCPVFFDFDAYRVSRDKKKSKEYFASVGVPTPLDRPLKPPYFVKPSCESGSVGTSIIYDEEELRVLDPSMLIEEYVEGDVVSLEIVGDGTRFAVVKETLVHIDGSYDCHKVTPLPYDLTFREIAHTLAKGLSLKGIMDVEAIKGEKGLKVIEIDARFPSQTPTVVYHSSGINLVELLFKAFEGEIEGKGIGVREEKGVGEIDRKRIGEDKAKGKGVEKIKGKGGEDTEKGGEGTEKGGLREIDALPKDAYCIFEHLMLEKESRTLVPVGEHVLSENSEYGAYYTEEGLELFLGRGKQVVFTLIAWGSDKKEAEKGREKGLEILAKDFGLNIGLNFDLKAGRKTGLRVGINTGLNL